MCKGKRGLRNREHFGVPVQITPHRWLAHCPSSSPIPPLGLLGGISSDQGGDSAKGITGHGDWLLPPYKAYLSWTSKLFPAACLTVRGPAPGREAGMKKGEWTQIQCTHTELAHYPTRLPSLTAISYLGPWGGGNTIILVRQ